METIINNWMLFLVIFLMLLGAFFIGYIFGAKKSNTPIKNTKGKLQQDATDTVKSRKRDSNQIKNSVAEYEPGKIRVTKTRERAGKLTTNDATDVEPVIKTKNSNKESNNEQDDLTKISGINSDVEKKLHIAGIHSYSQISELSNDKMRVLSKEIDIFPGRMHRDDWKGQAKELMRKE